MFNVILFEPEIPPNAGNAIRLCANTGASLHLVRPLGFAIDDARVRRAGLDYREMARVHVHANLEGCLASLAGARVFAVETTAGPRYDEVRYAPGDAFLFGRETAGLPAERVAAWPPDRLVRLPMVPGNTASTSRTRSRWSCSRPGGSSGFPAGPRGREIRARPA